MWIACVLVYAIINGFFSVLRKKAGERSHILFVIALYSTVGFLCVSWGAVDASSLTGQALILIIIKSFVVSLSWVFELIALKSYMISSLQPISAVKVAIGFFASMLIFHEANGWWRYIGLAIIFVGLILMNNFDRRALNRSKETLSSQAVITKPVAQDVGESTNQKVSSNVDILTLKRKRILAIVCFIIACICSETSGILDKFIVDRVTPTQMQFWFMLFVSIISWVYVLILSIKNKKSIIRESDWKNFYIYIIGVILILQDRFLFIGLTDPNVLVSGVSIMKQISVVVSTIVGGLIFKEPNLKQKIIYLVIILTGIIIVIV